MFFTPLTLSTIAALGCLLPISGVHAHGYAWDPMSRNSYAHEYGLGEWTGSNTQPLRTYNHAGLENGGDTFGACGSQISDARRYTRPQDWLTPSGEPVPFQAQATYAEGQEITIRSFLTANHRGHIEMYACPDVADPTDACFRSHPLDFVEDLLHGAPKDENYPLRAMIAPPDAVNADTTVDTTTPPGEGGDLYVHKFKLPRGLHGDEILLQWFWVTANKCRAEGYVDYPWPDASWHPSGNLDKVCETPYADCSREPGRTDCKDPQIFRNCIEVMIERAGPPPPTGLPTANPSLRPSASSAPTSGPNPTVAPTPAPSPRPSSSMDPTESPTVPPTKAPTAAEGCCSANHRDCHPQLLDACNGDEASCLGCNRYWLVGGALSGCLAFNDMGCDAVPCCEGLVCKNDGANTKCRRPAPVPTPNPTQNPLTSEPTPPACTICDDTESNWMRNKGYDCPTDAKRIDTKCNKDNKWTEEGWCRLSCYKAGNGYLGDLCCVDGPFNRKNLRKR